MINSIDTHVDFGILVAFHMGDIENPEYIYEHLKVCSECNKDLEEIAKGVEEETFSKGF